MKKFIYLSVILAAVGSASATLYSIDKDPQHVLYGNLAQNDPILVGLLGQQLASVACGPVAVTNSFRYLENQYPGIYNGSLTSGGLAQTAATLAGAMGTQWPGGTFADDLIWYKMQHVEAAVPGMTTYGAQYWPTWGWSIWDDPAAQRPAWVQSAAPTWSWIYNQLVACEDVEILMTYEYEDGGHFVTVKSFHWNDANNDGVIQQGENAQLDFIDPCTGQAGISQIWNSMYLGLPCLKLNYGGGAFVTMAVKESPIPEPASVCLLAMGVILAHKRLR